MANVPQVYCIKINDIKDFLQCLECFDENWLFRGHANADWPLSTSLERANNDHVNELDIHCFHHSQVRERLIKFHSAELRYCDEYAAAMAYRRLANIPQPDFLVELLARMQHYGTPTRLLDVTQSLLLALFFAFDGYSKNSRAIWAFNRPFFYESSDLAKHNRCFDFDDPEFGAEEYHDLMTNKERLYKACLKETENYIHKETEPYSADKKLIIPIEVTGNNPRLVAQNGAFLFPSTLKPFEDHLMTILKKSRDEYDAALNSEIEPEDFFENKIFDTKVVKMVFPISFRKDAEQLLTAANISARSVYPDEVGLAKSIRYW